MSEWSQLPNAVHIRRLIDSSKINSSIWDLIYDNTDMHSEAFGNAWQTAYELCQVDNKRPIWDSVWDSIIRDTDVDRAALAWCAATAILAWDDCTYMLYSDPSELAMIAALGDERAILILPTCIALSKEKSK